jgi:hypothetical protein
LQIGRGWIEIVSGAMASPSRSVPLSLAGLLLLGGAALRADWPLLWDFDGRSDQPMAASLGPGGDLWVLSNSHVQGSGTSIGVLLRIGADGGIVWAADDPGLANPVALALRADGSALALGRSNTVLQVTAFTAAGGIAWSRTRLDVAPDFVFTGPHASPIWDEAAGLSGGWRIPTGIGGDFAVVSYAGNGDALPDILWSPPEGTGKVTSILPRAGGGLLISGVVEDDPPPGWWTVALDAAGAEEWKHFESGKAPAGAFSGAFLLSGDPVRVWADDETGCGLFSLRLWSLDAATGAPLWDATWPTTGFPGCDSFTPDSVTLSGGRIVAAGVGNVESVGASFDSIVVSFDAATGGTQWERVYTGATTGMRAEVASVSGTALVASTLFPQPNPGPTPLWLSSFDRDGAECVSPFEVLPARVRSSLATPSGHWLLVGYAFSFEGATTDDLVLQRVDDPCGALFADGFESGDTTAWTSATP